MLKHRHYPMEKGFVRRDTLYTCSVCGKKIVVNYNSYCAMRVISGTLSLAVPTVISLYTLKNGTYSADSNHYTMDLSKILFKV